MCALPAILGVACAIATTALACFLGAWFDQGTEVLPLADTLLASVFAVIPIVGLTIAVSLTASRALETRCSLPSRYDEQTCQPEMTLWAWRVATCEGDEGKQAGIFFLYVYAVAISAFAGLALSAMANLSAFPIGIGLSALLMLRHVRLSKFSGSPGTKMRNLPTVACAALAGCIAIFLMDLQNSDAYRVLFLVACGIFGMGFVSALVPPVADAVRALPRSPSINTATFLQRDDPQCVLTADLCLSQVSARYFNQDPFVFEHLDLNIGSGSFIGFCGGSGSGKSTLCRTLLGLLDPSEGEVRFGNPGVTRSALKRFPQGYLYGLVDSPPVSQMSIEQIISNFGTLSHNRVLAAATATGFINDIATLPLGLQTNVGPKGSMLSTSQRQLLQLTAAVARRTEILVLDNPISSLPDEKRAKILLRIKPLVTTLIVTSNSTAALSTADQVYALSNRKIARIGKKG